MKGKHIEGILKSKPAPFVAQTLYSGKEYKDFIGGKFDVNSALREADEEANKYRQRAEIRCFRQGGS